MGTTMHNLSQTDRQILALVDWNKAIPILIELIKAFIAKDWEKVFTLALELFRLVFQAELKLSHQLQADGHTYAKPLLDWSTLLPLILQIIKMIMDMIGEGNGDNPKPPGDGPIELSDKQIANALEQLARAARS